MNRLTRFSQPAGSASDHLAKLKQDYARMEARADKLKAERDKLVAALRNALRSDEFKAVAEIEARALLREIGEAS